MTQTKHTPAYALSPHTLINQGRANNIQSAKRLQEIARLEEINAELLEALELAESVLDTAWRHECQRLYEKEGGDYHGHKARELWKKPHLMVGYADKYGQDEYPIATALVKTRAAIAKAKGGAA